MMVRRSTKESLSRANDRLSLAKKLSAGLTKPFVRSFDVGASDSGESRTVVATKAQLAQLGAGAVKAASNSLREAGISGVVLSPAAIEIHDSLNSSRLMVAKKASCTVRGEVKATDGVRVSTKSVSISVDLDGGRFTTAGFSSGKGLLPINKANLKVAMDSPEKEEAKESDEVKKK